MNLTTEQKTTLKTDVLANGDTLALYNDGNLAGLADLYNGVASPDFTVWRTAVTKSEIMNNGFVWTSVDALSVGKARIWDWMVDPINPAKANIRQGLADAFGTGTAMANGILPHLKRKATRFEKLFATGTGSDVSPGTMTLEGAIGYESFIGL